MVSEIHKNSIAAWKMSQKTMFGSLVGICPNSVLLDSIGDYDAI